MCEDSVHPWKNPLMKHGFGSPNNDTWAIHGVPPSFVGLLKRGMNGGDINDIPIRPRIHSEVVDVRLRKDGELPLGLSLHYALSENKIGGAG